MLALLERAPAAGTRTSANIRAANMAAAIRGMSGGIDTSGRPTERLQDVLQEQEATDACRLPRSPGVLPGASSPTRAGAAGPLPVDPPLRACRDRRCAAGRLRRRDRALRRRGRGR